MYIQVNIFVRSGQIYRKSYSLISKKINAQNKVTQKLLPSIQETKIF